MDATWLALALVVVLLLVSLAVLRSRSRPAPDSRHSSGLDTLAAWEPQATRVLTSAERLAMKIAVQALPEFLVLAQVPLARFIRVPTRHSYGEWLRRVGQLCPDLLICDSTSQVLAVIEVRPPARRMTERAKARAERMRRVLKAAGIPMHVWVEDALPTVAAARASLMPHGAAARTREAPVEDPTAPPTVPVAAPAGLRPGDGGEAFEPLEPDEVIEMREPPPSTWFDELGAAESPRAAAPAAPPDRRGSAPRR